MKDAKQELPKVDVNRAMATRWNQIWEHTELSVVLPRFRAYIAESSGVLRHRKRSGNKYESWMFVFTIVASY